MGKVRPRFRDPPTAGKDHNLDLPEGSVRTGIVHHFHCSLSQCSLFISRPKNLLGAKATVSRYEKNCGRKDASHLHTAFNFSEYSYPNIAP